MLTQWFTVPVNPEPWVVGSVGVRRTTGSKRGYIAPDEQLQNYQAAVKQHIVRNYPDRRIINDECELNFYFIRRLDRYVTPSDRAHMRHVADATNMQKALEDALQGVLVANDRLVRRITSETIAQNPDMEPGIVVCLKSEYQPLWEREIPRAVWQMSVDERVKVASLDLGNAI